MATMTRSEQRTALSNAGVSEAAFATMSGPVADGYPLDLFAEDIAMLDAAALTVD